MRRVEDVLGKGWENHVEGQRLKADGDSFRQKLNTQELFDEWSKKVGTLWHVKTLIIIFLTKQGMLRGCLLYTSPSPRDQRGSRMPSSA